jgi:ABC-type Mn2+/Zn2+ transport system permease subunit
MTTTTLPDASGLLLALAGSAAAGLVGSIAVLRRMALASDAMSHVALPGVGLAILLHLNPVVGALAALCMGTLLIWAVEHKTQLPTEAIIGVVFSAALAIGSMLSSGEELLEVLFGAPHSPGRAELLLGLAAAGIVIAFILRAQSRLVITMVSEDLALTAGIDVARMNLFFLLAFSLTVSLGLRYLGVLLMGSLIIIPAATAKHLARSLRSMRYISVVVAVSSTLIGTFAAPRLGLKSGPLIITVAAGMFFTSLLWRRERGS